LKAAAPPQRAAADEASSLSGVRVLLLDHSVRSSQILARLLAGWGMEACAASATDDAVRLIAEARLQGAPYQLLICELEAECFPGLRNECAASGIRKLVMTRAGEKPTVWPSHGIVGCIAKPFKRSEIQRTLIKAVTGGTDRKLQEDCSIIEPVPGRRHLAGLRILVAEDNLINQKIVQRVLEKQGHTVLIAANGREALDLHEVEALDLIVMDIQMPVLDGLDATAIIRDREKASGQHIAIIAATAFAMKSDEERCIAAGMDAYVSKPIQAQTFLDAIDRLMLKANGASA
jgi:CheY-like chemotaxis protein